MSFLPDSLVAVVRTLHVVAAVTWLGGLWLSAWFDHRVYPTMRESTLAEFAPRMSAALWPWLSITAVLTVLLGLLVYLDLGGRAGFGFIAWSVHAGAVLALVVVVIQFAFLVPAHVALARGGDLAPVPHRQATARWALAAAVLSALVAILMLGATRMGGFFR